MELISLLFGGRFTNSIIMIMYHYTRFQNLVFTLMVLLIGQFNVIQQNFQNDLFYEMAMFIFTEIYREKVVFFIVEN